MLLELKALKDIVFEMSGGRVNAENNWGKSKKTGRRAISEARQYSQLYYHNNNAKDLSAFKSVYGMQHFTAEIIVDMVDSVRDCFEVERREIEQEIDRLNDSLDGNFEEMESDVKMTKSFEKVSIGSPSPVPNEKMELCSMCSVRKPASSFDNSLVCSTCHLSRQRREAKLGSGNNTSARNTTSSSSSNNLGGSLHHSQSTPTQLTAEMARLDISGPAFQYNSRNNNEDSPDSAPISSGKSSSRGGSAGGAASKFRNRLDSARHEHHFLDEF